MEFPRFQFDKVAVAKELGSPGNCLHEHHELRYKPDKNGKPRYNRQCLACGSPFGSRVRAADVPDADRVPKWDCDLPRRVWTEYHERLNSYRNRELQAARSRWNAHYYQIYLPSREWKERRKLVMLRAQGICEGCRLCPATDVHHLTYQNVGEEFLFQLVALCRPCHDRLHQQLFPRFLESLFYSGFSTGGTVAKDTECDSEDF